jgi:folate-binding protein YgfZ
LPGFDLWIETEESAGVKSELSNSIPLCDQKCAEQFRIEQGIPLWGKELTEDTIPVEANLEASCIDYEKGCYIGQEVISRMKMSGQRNKGLYGLVAGESNALIGGMKLWPIGNDTKEAGWITSVTWSDRLGRHIGLGYVKRPFNQAGTDLRAKADNLEPVMVKIVGLPFDPSAL